MKTEHKIFINNSCDMGSLKNESVDLILTSPPYPMIEMWDELFIEQNENVAELLSNNKEDDAFFLIHEMLNDTWKESYRVLKYGGLLCVNIGDAARNINNNFKLYSNHTVISYKLILLGLNPLPVIIWRKSTNKPNKFMGSGMLPPNAYVTLEHEYILIFRKGNIRKFPPKNTIRHESAIFWEERNKLFSDVWTDLVGVSQIINHIDKTIRNRSAAFPLELATRIISMFSVYSDTVLDPFWGVGTTTLAAIFLNRNSIGYELQEGFLDIFKERLKNIDTASLLYNNKRIENHSEFITNWKNNPKHLNINYSFPVVTSQERNIKLYTVNKININKDNIIEAHYEDYSGRFRLV